MGRKPQTESSQLAKSRFVAGAILVVVAVLILLLAKGSCFTDGAVGIGLLGLVSTAISRRKRIAAYGPPDNPLQTTAFGADMRGASR